MAFHTMRGTFLLLAVAIVGFCLVLLLTFQFQPAYEELGLADPGAVLDIKVLLFPRSVERRQINPDDVEWLEYTSPDQGIITLVGGAGSRTLIFEDFNIDQNVADSISTGLNKPLEIVTRLKPTGPPEVPRTDR